MEKVYSIKDCYKSWTDINKDSLNPLTFRRYTNLMEKHLLPYFADTAACQITEKDIDIFVGKKQEENMSEVTLNMLIMLLKRLLQTAGIDTVKLGLEHTVRIKTNKKVVDIMAKEEQHFLDVILSTSEEPKYLGICLAFKMGLAIGEICALEWSDVDFETETIQIRNTVQRLQNTKEESRKTLLVRMPLTPSSERKLPIPKTVMKDLKTCREKEGYVLRCKEGRIPDPRREQIRLEKLFDKKGMKAYNFYALRDTFAVRCLQAGMSIEDLSYVLGHSNVSITADRYKVFLEAKQERTAVLRRIMELV